MATISASPVAGRGLYVGLGRPRWATPVVDAPPQVADESSVEGPAIAPPVGIPVHVQRLVATFAAVFVATLVVSGLSAGRTDAVPVRSVSGAVAVETAAYPAYTVLPGDTLWSIAERVNPEADPRATVLQLQVLNRLSGSQVLQPGQVLQTPAHVRADG